MNCLACFGLVEVGQIFDAERLSYLENHLFKLSSFKLLRGPVT